MSLRALLAVAALSIAAPAFAQTPPAGDQGGQSQNPAWAQNRDAMRKACAADLKTYCSDLPQGGRMGQCLRQNADKLSPDCRTALEKMRPMMHDQQPQPH